MPLPGWVVRAGFGPSLASERGGAEVDMYVKAGSRLRLAEVCGLLSLGEE